MSNEPMTAARERELRSISVWPDSPQTLVKSRDHCYKLSEALNDVLEELDRVRAVCDAQMEVNATQIHRCGVAENALEKLQTEHAAYVTRAERIIQEAFDNRCQCDECANMKIHSEPVLCKLKKDFSK